jgi:hypothetical protein
LSLTRRAHTQQGEFLYGVVRDVTREKKVEETLRRFLLTTRRAQPFDASHRTGHHRMRAPALTLRLLWL